MEYVIVIYALHERHPGLTSAIAAYYAEGASVCLSRHRDDSARSDRDDKAFSLEGRSPG
jgi:hypothetical protein